MPRGIDHLIINSPFEEPRRYWGYGAFSRLLCVKLATGTGKTVVMAMAIAWHVLNKVADPQDRRFARHVLVVAPGLTVKSRLEVLEPAHDENYYDAFDVVPSALRERLLGGLLPAGARGLGARHARRISLSEQGRVYRRSLRREVEAAPGLPSPRACRRPWPPRSLLDRECETDS